MFEEGFREINPEIPIFNETFRNHSTHKSEMCQMIRYYIRHTAWLIRNSIG